MIKLNVGCGRKGARFKDFIGIDLLPHPEGVPKELYIQADFLTANLPWKEGEVDEIICLHMIEHLMPKDGEKLIRRCLQLLNPDGGSLVITCPDLWMLCRAYIDSDEDFLKKRHTGGKKKEIWPGDTLGDRLNWAIHQETHKWSYDIVSLTNLVEKAGDNFGFTYSRMTKTHFCSTRPDHEIGIVIERAYYGEAR